ncbi:MAG: CidA/LrgA family protein [Clostridiaceae bacterium]|nr:CidA/LrgA family protein [Clostridiaceae bacterium]
MKYIKQFTLILLITFLGEILNMLLPLPVPASIYGMVLLYVCLLTGIIRLEQIRETGRYLVEIMPVMFIPAGVGLLQSWGVLKPVFVPFAVITFVSTVVVMAVAGRVTQFVMRRGNRRKEHGTDQ